MGALSRWAVDNPKKTVGLWVALVALIITLGATLGGSYNTSFSLPDTESSRAQTLIQDKFGQSGTDATAQIVFSPATGTIDDASIKASVDRLLTEVATIPGVTSVASPYASTAGGQPAGRVNGDRTVGVATVTFDAPETEVAKSSVTTLVNEVKAAASDEMQVGASGQVIDFASTDAPSSEGLGVLAALIILLFTFGSLVTAGLPILTAIIALVCGLSLVTVAARFMDIATFAPTLAAMIGLGVGIDYALFVINRYRQAVIAGKEPRAAAQESVRTAGRAVLFAGSTVVIALMGLFVVGIEFLNGLAVAAAITVLMTMLAALTLLPAVLSWLGTKAFAVRMPWARKGPRTAEESEGRGFSRHGASIQRRPWAYALGALGLMVVLIIPVFSLRFGFPDSGGKPVGDVQRTAYDLTSRGFGPGSNGPFLVAVELPKAGDLAPAESLQKALTTAPGVASVGPVVPDKDKTAALIQVVPTTSPQDDQTGRTLDALRSDVIPPALAGTGAIAYVGGSTAVTEDFGSVIASALPLFLTVVVLLGVIALMLLFRSIVVPLTAAVTSLLSLGAAMGTLVAVFQWGWFNSILGVTATGPIPSFLPVMLFAILFGLSMDYQVFLVSRMQEEWSLTHDNRRAVRRGLAGSGRVVMAAAAIMTSVFVAFVFGDNSTIKMFGIGLASAVFLDAFVVRLVLVPAVMTLFGPANWWLPSWLASRLPHIEIEAEAADSAEIYDGPDDGSDDDLDDQPVGASV